MTYERVQREAARLTFDRDMAGEIVLLVMKAVADERVACATVAANMMQPAVAAAIRMRSSVE